MKTNNDYNESNYFSSPASSISQLNVGGSTASRRERLQDPLKILKTIRNSSSHLNSLNSNLNEDGACVAPKYGENIDDCIKMVYF